MCALCALGFRRGERSRCRQGWVSDAGCVPGKPGCLGEQIFRSLFYVCKSKESERGYARLQGFYHGSPQLRLLIPDVSFHREEAFQGGTGPPGCFASMHRGVTAGALQKRLTSERSISTRTGPIGSGCTTALYA